jgi:transcriptional regulator with XRE-family HTH domain
MSIEIGNRLRSLREARGLSQEAVARQTNIGLKAYGDLERGRTIDPHYSTLEGIAHALSTTVAELVGEEPALAGSPGKPDAPQKTGLADADPSSKLIEAKVLEEIAELWAEQLARGFYDRHTLGMMRIAGGILAMSHDAALGEDRENLPPSFLEQLAAAEERFVAVDAQIWEAIEEADHGRPVLPDELAARRKARNEASEALRQQLRSGVPVEAEAN